MVNLIATIPGRRSDRIVLATHYDTKLFREFRFVGASDGASSTAAVLELGRVLKGQPHEYTIELAFFDGEHRGAGMNPPHRHGRCNATTAALWEIHPVYAILAP